MARQDLKLRAAAIEFRRKFKGKMPGIRELRDFAKSHGYIETGPEAVDEWELSQTRRLIQRIRHFDNEDESGKTIMIPLFELLEDGSKVEYWRLTEDCTIDESIQHLDYWYRYGRTGDRNFHFFFREFCKFHGSRAIQRRLKYEIPTDPDLEPVEV